MPPLSRCLLLAMMITLNSLAGCGGGSEDSSQSDDFSTGVEGSRVLAELSPQELDQVCAANTAFAKQTFTDERMCRLFVIGMGFPQSEQECEAGLQECLSEGVQTPSDECAREEIKNPTCRATIALYEQCFREISSEFARIMDGATCSNPDPSVAQENEQIFGSNDTAQTPSCVELQSQCPSFKTN